MLEKNWLKSVLDQCAALGLRTFPAKGGVPLRKHGEQGADYKDLGDYDKADMVSVKLGDGLILLDYDGNKDGALSIEELEEALDLDLVGMPGPVQVNESGDSIHWLFKVPAGVDGLRNSAIGAWPRVDVLYGSSLMHLKPNKRLDFGNICEDCPDALIEKLQGGVSAGTTEDSDGLMAAVMAASKLDLSDEEVAFYLSRVPDEDIGDQDTWLRVGMAIKHQYADEPEKGWEIFDQFSRRGPGYDEAGNLVRWESFGKRQSVNPVTFASVIKMVGGATAKSELKFDTLVGAISDAGNQGQLEKVCVSIANEQLSEVQLDSLITLVQRRFKDLDVVTGKPAVKRLIKTSRTETKVGDFVDRYVYCTSDSKFIDRETKLGITREAFNIKHGHETPMGENGEPVAPSQYAVGRIDIVDFTMYFPAAAEVFHRDGLTYLNEYRESSLVSIEPTSGIVERVRDHIAHLLADKYEQDLFLYYLAHNIQKPGKKIPWSIVLQGTQGDGKSFFGELMYHVLGDKNVRQMSAQTLESTFTGWAVGQCVTFIEELKVNAGARYDVVNHMKPYITNDTIEVVKKGKDPVTVVNTTNYIAFTNFKDAVPLGDHDRRYCVLASRWQRKVDIEAFIEGAPDYYASLYEDMRTGAGEIKYWLENIEIPGWFFALKRAPKTQAKEAMIRESLPHGTVILRNAIEDLGPDCMEGDELDITKLIVEAGSGFHDGEFDDLPTKRGLSKALEDLGYEFVERRRCAGQTTGNKHRFYRLVQ